MSLALEEYGEEQTGLRIQAGPRVGAGLGEGAGLGSRGAAWE